ncbi:Fic family protein [Oxalobacteraceae bacterium A2-2]
MKMQTPGFPKGIRDLVEIEFRGVHLTWLSCLAHILRFCGRGVSLADLLSQAPIPMGGPSQQQAFKIARQLGFEVCLADLHKAAWRNTPHSFLIAQRKSSYSFIISEKINNNYRLILPGYHGMIVMTETEINRDNKFICLLTYRSNGILPRQYKQHQKLWLIPWEKGYLGNYDAAQVDVIRRELETLPSPNYCKPSLASFSVKDLLLTHSALCPNLPKHYGVFRRVNLKREADFVDFNHIFPALSKLISVIENTNAAKANNPVNFSAKFFCDFLTIHPFLNGNRRIAILLISNYLKEIDYTINWEEISLSELYYWTRLASRGKIYTLENGLLRALKK